MLLRVAAGFDLRSFLVESQHGNAPVGFGSSSVPVLFCVVTT